MSATIWSTGGLSSVWQPDHLQLLVLPQYPLLPELLQLSGNGGVDGLQSDWVPVIHMHCATLKSQLSWRKRMIHYTEEQLVMCAIELWITV